MKNITESIEVGRTRVFKDRFEAQDFAKEKNSYMFDLLAEPISTQKTEVEFYGYGVPC